MLEFGACIDRNEKPSKALSRLSADRDKLLATWGDRFDINLVPYEGTNEDYFRGGRHSPFSADELIEFIKAITSHGFSFMVPFNGGMELNRGDRVDLDREEFKATRRILDCLAEATEAHAVKTYATILRDELLEVVKEKYSKIKTVASCIKFVGGRKGEFRGREEYTKAFEAHDDVTILPQHTTPDFLQNYRQYVGKMVLLATSTCGQTDLYGCYEHYAKSESPYNLPDYMIGKPKHVPPRSDFDFIPSQRPEEEGPSPCQNYRNALLERPDDLRYILELGVRKFKFARYANSSDRFAVFLGHLLRAIEKVNPS